MNRVLPWVPVILLAVSLVATGAVAQFQISSNAEDIEDLQEDQKAQIRMEERQKQLKEQLDRIEKKLDEVND